MTSQLIYSANGEAQPEQWSIRVALMPKQNPLQRRDTPANILLDASPHYLQVLTWLLIFRFMTADQLARLLDPPRTLNAVQKLLRRMFDAQLIARIQAPAQKAWGPAQPYGASKVLHCPDRQGVAFYAERMGMETAEVDWKPRDNQKANLMFMDHRLASNDILISMYLAARQQGWNFEIAQTERDIHKKGGHDFVIDPSTRERKPAKADAVGWLKRAPSPKRAWFSLETDMGTEAEKKVKQKMRLHRTHYDSGIYQKRHDTRSSRYLFVVADVRDPYLVRPIDEADWKERVQQRAMTLKRWAEEEGMGQQFWFGVGYALSDENIWNGRIWVTAGQQGAVSFIEPTQPSG